MLEGLDHQWNEVGSDQRTASYTTLPAGVYTFRVQGATARGPWSEPGVALRILPPWWGTWWFRSSCVVMILVLLWALHQFRLHQIAQEFSARLEGRVDERTRIARDLHDTLLQSFQGVLLKFQAVTFALPDRPAEARKTLEGHRGGQAGDH